jgi:hypothetical protein
MKNKYICEIITEKCKNIKDSVTKNKYFCKHYWIGSIDATVAEKQKTIRNRAQMIIIRGFCSQYLGLGSGSYLP